MEILEGVEQDHFSRMRVLQVEDEEILRRVMDRGLGDLGVAHTAVESALKAREIFNADDSFNVLITDFDMPGMNGAELIRELKAKKPDLLTLLLSGREEGDGDVAASLGDQVCDFIERKPIRLSTLQERLETFNTTLAERETTEVKI